MTSSSGGASVGYSLTKDIIGRALAGLDNDADTEMMWFYLEKVKGIKKKILPDERNNNITVRLTLDYEEDYWLLSSIVRILGNNAGREDVEGLFVKNPDLCKINLFRSAAWKAAQLSKTS